MEVKKRSKNQVGKKSIKYLEHSYKARLDSIEIDTTPTIKAIKSKSTINWTISEEKQMNETNLRIEDQSMQVKERKKNYKELKKLLELQQECKDIFAWRGFKHFS